MKVSLNTLRQYIDVELPPTNELVDRINSQLGAIEEIIDINAKYKDAVIVKVIECDKHPNADRLSVTKIDDHGATADVPRDEHGLVQVVCGAPNVNAGMLAIWLPPNSAVPASFDDAEPFVLSARELRGVLSQGMLAAADELDLGADHEGIIEITDYDVPLERKDTPLDELVGQSFTAVFGLDDTIIDIENKMFTHRPDLFGQLGVAREVKAILAPERDDTIATEQDILEPDWFWQAPKFTKVDGLSLDVFNHAPELAPRFMAVAMKDVTIAPSPLWLQIELVRWGSKPINNVVDVTNYIMLLTAQPVHAYDYDKLRGHTIGTRMAVEGETATLLNGKTYELSPDDIVIADGEGVIGLAGIMGGGNSEVSAETKNIVLEVATFDMYAVRRTSMRHGVFTDALTRFNKGQSKLQNDRVLGHLMDLMHRYASATQSSDVFDKNDFTDQTDVDTLSGELRIRAEFINQRLGLALSETAIGNLLRLTNFAVFQPQSDSDELSVTAPFWRTDIELPEDVVEEVGRLYSFDRLPRELPKRSTKPTPTNEYRELTQRVREALARAGVNEVLTYSFVHERILKAAGQNPEDAYRLSNALSPDLQYYRLSVTPSLLDKVHGNIKAGYDEFGLFEIGKSHSKKAGLDVDGLPVEPARIAMVYAAKTPQPGAAYYKAKATLDYVASSLGLQFEYKPLPAETTLTAAAPFVEGRMARVIDRASEQAVGIIGEYTTAVKKAFKLPEYTAGFELFTEGLILACRQTSHGSHYTPLRRYPSIERDTCFEVSEGTTFEMITQSLMNTLKAEDVDIQVDPVDIYQGDTDTRRITLRTRLTPHNETMTKETANEIVDHAAKESARRIGATII